MSRSKHTDPRSIRAERRVRAPREPRGVDDLTRRRRLRRLFKEFGIVAAETEDEEFAEPVQPRITVCRPRSEFFHPAGRAEIRRMLEFLGPEAIYGIKQIELAHTPGMPETGIPPLGRLIVPGRIVIYEQPCPPWQLPGVLSEKDTRRLELAGAVLEVAPSGVSTIVQWPEATLRDFMLFEVLAHEIGHHLLQHHKGKRTVRIARTRDHEAFAQRFAEQCRAAWFASQEKP